MSISELFGQSAILTIMGMAVVFLFLWILITFVKLASRIITASEAKAGNGAEPEVQRADSDPKVIAAISSAVTEYRNTHEGR
jgi:oxaloacetate decarboxylase gamma subunit